jgi:hypothetical protein
MPSAGTLDQVYETEVAAFRRMGDAAPSDHIYRSTHSRGYQARDEVRFRRTGRG